MEEKLYTVEEAASYIDVSRSAVYKWAKAGILPGKQYGNVWRFTKEQLENPKPSARKTAEPAKETRHGRKAKGEGRVLVLPV